MTIQADRRSRSGPARQPLACHLGGGGETANTFLTLELLNVRVVIRVGLDSVETRPRWDTRLGATWTVKYWREGYFSQQLRVRAQLGRNLGKGTHT